MAIERDNPVSVARADYADRATTAENVSGVVAVEHGGTGVTDLTALKDIVNTYEAKGTDKITLIKEEYAKTKDGTTRTVCLRLGYVDFIQIFRTDATYGCVVIFGGYGDQVQIMSQHAGTWYGPDTIFQRT